MMVCVILEVKERLEVLLLFIICEFFKILLDVVELDFDKNGGCIILEVEKLFEMFFGCFVFVWLLEFLELLFSIDGDKCCDDSFVEIVFFVYFLFGVCLNVEMVDLIVQIVVVLVCYILLDGLVFVFFICISIFFDDCFDFESIDLV